MAFGIYFATKNMTAEKFAALHEQLSAIDQASPPGRTFHAGFRVGERSTSSTCGTRRRPSPHSAST